MDSLTQIVVGIATAQAVADKELKNKTYWVGAVLGTFPDLDVIIGKLFSYEIELAFHRAFTHSLFGILILSPIIGFIFSKFLKELHVQKWIWLVACALLTHVGIDLFTSWGVQLLYPHDERYSFKTIFVVDFLYSLPWLVGLGIIFFKNDLKIRKRILIRSFISSSVYLLLTICVKFYVENEVKKVLNRNNINSQSFITKPTFSNVILWNINVKSNDTFYISDYSLFDKKDAEFEMFYSNGNWENKLANYVPFQKLKQVSEGWYTIDSIGPKEYLFNDLRFGTIINEQGVQQFVFSYKLNIDDKNTLTVSETTKTLKDGKGALGRIVNRILNTK